MKTPLISVMCVIVCAAASLAGDVPSGFLPLSKLSDAQAKARQSKKLIAITAHGSDDQCPYTADAFAKGTAALRSSCVMVYTRVSDFRSQKDSLPASLKTPAETAVDGAAVAFYVYDPDLGKIIASVNRGQIEKDPKSLTATKKMVSEAQKQLAGSSAAGGTDPLDVFHKPTR